MCPSFWKFYLDDFPCFGSSQTALGRVLDELERNNKKENNLSTISKMMGALVLVQFYTFSYRKALIQHLKIAKNRRLRVKTVKI